MVPISYQMHEMYHYHILHKCDLQFTQNVLIAYLITNENEHVQKLCYEYNSTFLYKIYRTYVIVCLYECEFISKFRRLFL